MAKYRVHLGNWDPIDPWDDEDEEQLVPEVPEDQRLCSLPQEIAPMLPGLDSCHDPSWYNPGGDDGHLSLNRNIEAVREELDSLSNYQTGCEVVFLTDDAQEAAAVRKKARQLLVLYAFDPDDFGIEVD